MVTQSTYMLCDPAMAFSLFLGSAAEWWSHDRVRVNEPPRYLEVDLRGEQDDGPSKVSITFTEEVPGTLVTVRDESAEADNNAPLWEGRLRRLSDDLGAAS